MTRRRPVLLVGVLLAVGASACTVGQTSTGTAGSLERRSPDSTDVDDPGAASGEPRSSAGASDLGDIGSWPAPIGIGSRTNRVGSDPDADVLADYWLTLAGPGTDKSEGALHQSAICGDSLTSGCPGGVTGPAPNPEFDDDGLVLSVRIDPDAARTASGDLVIQLFDPAFVDTGDDCTAGMPTVAELERLRPIIGVTDRYEPGPTKWCTGDSGAGASDGVVTTTLVRAPDESPDDADNRVIDRGGCTEQTFTPHGGDDEPSVAQLLDPSDGIADVEAQVDPDDGVITFAESFRQWVTVCTIPAAQVVPGEYLVQVRAPAGSVPSGADPTSSAQGLNQFSVRAGFGSADSLDATGVQVATRRNATVTVNDRGHTPGGAELPLVLEPQDPDDRFEISLFDLSDGGRSFTRGQVRPYVGAEPLSACALSSLSSGGPGRPSRAADTDSLRCTVSYAPDELDDMLVGISPGAPDRCLAIGDGGCTLALRFVVGPGESIRDTISVDALAIGKRTAPTSPAEPVQPERPDAPKGGVAPPV